MGTITNNPRPELEEILTGLIQMNRMLVEVFLGVSARFDALKVMVCELHPEAAGRLEKQIEKDANEAANKFAELQSRIEFLRGGHSGPIH